jgi:hypothetical protein
MDNGEVKFRSQQDQEFSTPHNPDQFWHPPSLYSNGYRRLSLWVKQLRLEGDHTPPTNAKVMKTCSMITLKSKYSTATLKPLLLTILMHSEILDQKDNE